MGRLGIGEMLLIFAVLLLLFGATRLPMLGSSLGSAIRNFKRGFSGEEEQDGSQAQLGKGDKVEKKNETPNS